MYTKQTQHTSLTDAPQISFFYNQQKQNNLYVINDAPRNDLVLKLTLYGPEKLSLIELFSLLFSGKEEESHSELARSIIREYGEKSIQSQRSIDVLTKEAGIPKERAIQIIVCAEIGKRFFQRNLHGLSILRTPEDVFEYAHDMRSLSREHMRGLYLNAHFQVIHDEVISIGTLDTSIIHPREVFKPAFEYGASAIILIHNHPSGICTPSKNDRAVTRRLLRVSKIIGIPLLDHIIVTRDSFCSVIH